MIHKASLTGLLGLAALASQAQVPPAPVSRNIDPVVVTATRALTAQSTLRDAIVISREDLESAGSLSLGGAVGTIAVATRHEIVLAIIGGLFVAELLSVVIQVAWFKRTGRRIFLMAPIHHHFEKLGWSESTVVIRFWIVSIMLALVGLATLKLR
jgi:hypothetical protein